jgi:pre-mRNA-processing factor 40
MISTEILANAAPQAPSQPTPTLPTRPMVQDAPTGLTAQSGALVAAGGYYPSNAARPSGSSPFVLPDYTSHDNAEKAFINMLHEIGVTPEWTWERTMRESITSPYYKVLKTLSERKTAFEKCVKAMIEEEKSLTEASLARSRKDWNKALEKLGGGPEREEGVKSWWKWESSGKRELEKRLPEDLWEGLRNDGERKTLFEDFVTNLKTKELVSLELSSKMGFR